MHFFFLSNTTFKILSVAISFALLRLWGVLVSFLLPLFFILCVASKWRYLAAGAPNHTSRLGMFNHPWINTEKQRMTNCAFNNLVLMCTHTIVLTGLVVSANCCPDTYVYNLGDLPHFSPNSQASINDNATIGEHVLHSFFDGYQLSSRALVQNLPLLNGLYVGILSTIVLHAGLFYWQIWKPFENAEEEEKERDRVKEKENELQQQDEVEMTTVSSSL